MIVNLISSTGFAEVIFEEYNEVLKVLLSVKIDNSHCSLQIEVFISEIPQSSKVQVRLTSSISDRTD